MLGKRVDKKAQAMQNQTLYLIVAVIILAIVGYFVWNFYQSADDVGKLVPQDLTLAIQLCRTYAETSPTDFCVYREMDLTNGGKVYGNCNYVYEKSLEETTESPGFTSKPELCKKTAVAFCTEKMESDSFRSDRVQVAGYEDGKIVEKTCNAWTGTDTLLEEDTAQVKESPNDSAV